MSEPGTNNIRGINYQLLVAMRYCLDLFIEKETDTKIFVDSCSEYIDDIVIVSPNSQVHVQCKKNAPKAVSWSIYTLGDELKKAFEDWKNNKNTRLVFFSGSSYSNLQTLVYKAKCYEDEESFELNLANQKEIKNKKANNDLKKLLKIERTFDFLRSIDLHCISDNEIENNIRKILKSHFNNSDVAFNALLSLAQASGSKSDTESIDQYSFAISYDVIKNKFKSNGLIQTDNLSEKNAFQKLREISKIGEPTRKNSSDLLPFAEKDSLIEKIQSQSQNTYLIIGEAGSGKSEFLFQLYCLYQNSPDYCCLFIRAEYFSHCIGNEELENNGLDNKWIDYVFFLAQQKKLIVFIDSLDVIANGSEKTYLYFLNCISRLKTCSNVQILIACRLTDYHFDEKLRQLACETIELKLPDWETRIKPYCKKYGLPKDLTDSDAFKHGINSLFRLRLILDLAKDVSYYDWKVPLEQTYLTKKVRNNPSLGLRALQNLVQIAKYTIERNSLIFSSNLFQIDENQQKLLVSAGIIIPKELDRYQFSHQEIQASLLLANEDVSLLKIIKNLPNTPFSRPVIRKALQNLINDKTKCQTQIKEVLNDEKIPYPIKRLIIIDYGRYHPENSDWELCEFIQNYSHHLFKELFANSDSKWQDFWCNNYFHTIIDHQDSIALCDFLWKSKSWDVDNSNLISIWEKSLSLNWSNLKQIRIIIASALSQLNPKYWPKTKGCIQNLLQDPNSSLHLGKYISNAAKIGFSVDEELWTFVTSDLNSLKTVSIRNINDNLRCENYHFCSSLFFGDYLNHSEKFRNFVITSIETWHNAISINEGNDDIYSFLSYTDCFHEFNNSSPLSLLFKGLKTALSIEAKKNSDWWEQIFKKLLNSKVAALSYLALAALTDINEPDSFFEKFCSIFFNEELFAKKLGSTLLFVWGSLFPKLSEKNQEKLLLLLEKKLSSSNDAWQTRMLLYYVSETPKILRSQSLHNQYIKEFGKEVHLSSEMITIRSLHEQTSINALKNLSDSCLIKILIELSVIYQSKTQILDCEINVKKQLADTIASSPDCKIPFLKKHWEAIQTVYGSAIFSGFTRNFESLKGKKKIQLALSILEFLLCIPIPTYCGNHDVAYLLEKISSLKLQKKYIVKLTECIFNTIQWDEKFPSSFDDPLTQALNSTVGQCTLALLMVFITKLKERANTSRIQDEINKIAQNFGIPIQCCIARYLHIIWFYDRSLAYSLFTKYVRDCYEVWTYCEEYIIQLLRKDTKTAVAEINNMPKCSLELIHMWARLRCFSIFQDPSSLEILKEELLKLKKPDAFLSASEVWTNEGNYRDFHTICHSLLHWGINLETEYAEKITQNITHAMSYQKGIIRLTADEFNQVLKLHKGKSIATTILPIGLDDWLLNYCNLDEETGLECVKVLTEKIQSSSVGNEYIVGQHWPQLLHKLYQIADHDKKKLKIVTQFEEALLKTRSSLIDQWELMV